MDVEITEMQRKIDDLGGVVREERRSSGLRDF